MATLIIHSFVLSLIIISSLSSPLSYSSTFQHTLKSGSSLNVDNPKHILVSPHGTFTAGFHQVGDNAYCFAIWFSDTSLNYTVVWMANRDTPINGKRSKLSLLKNGQLVLTDAGHSTIWSTNTFSLSSLSLALEETGNLVLITKEGVILWESFDSPTDTLLPFQPLTRDILLVSSRSRSNFSSGFYKLCFDDDNVLRLLYDGPETSSAFWPHHWLLSREANRSTFNSSRIAVLDNLGKFSSSDDFTSFAADYGARLQRRLTLDFDGNLRMYSNDQNKGGSWVISWQVFPEPCAIHGYCGPNSVCSYSHSFGRRTCSCLAGFRRKNHSDWSLGCEPEFNVSCVEHDTASTFLQLPHVESYGYDFGFLVNTTLDDCKKICSQRCDCKGFEFKFIYQNHPDNIPYCFPKTQLRNIYWTPSFRGVLYVKVPKNNTFSNNLPFKKTSLDCPIEVQKKVLDRKYEKIHKNWPLNFLLWFVFAIGVVEILVIALVWLLLFRTHQNEDATNKGFLLPETGFKRFAYAELKKATRKFREEIGRGAGGIVYKGVLSNDRVAAIKKLYESDQGEAEFQAEASTIGRLNHMNLIQMWGYCAEGRHRLLVYEYMEHGSLAENLSSQSLDYKKRFEIAVGTAKGLAYLHEECLEWVLHCDLKPQNILLDSDYQPKVSDFGLSKFLNRSGDLNNLSFSRIRGTRGYMAPEWTYRLAITSKVDVYSYGVVVLEMVTGKSPTGIATLESEGLAETGRLVTWVREKMNDAATTGESWIEGILDPRIASNCEMSKIHLLVKMALKCVEDDVNARPTMSQVVKMLLKDY